MIVIAPSKLAIASHTPIVPLAKLGISNTPIGPFHTTVLASFNTFENNSTVAGPTSNPISSSANASTETTRNSVSLENSLAATVSTGKTNLSPPFSNKAFAKSNLSSSHKDLPMFFP